MSAAATVVAASTAGPQPKPKEDENELYIEMMLAKERWELTSRQLPEYKMWTLAEKQYEQVKAKRLEEERAVYGPIQVEQIQQERARFLQELKVKRDACKHDWRFWKHQDISYGICQVCGLEDF